jgi:16S rRNA (cytosine1402-N4)-methyltransferase
MTRSIHRPVLIEEVVAALAPRAGGVYVDGTFGGGGYSKAILDAAPCTVWGIDRDPAAIARGDGLAAEYRGRLMLVVGRYGEMDVLLGERGMIRADGVTLDLGVSSDQLDDPRRGFSFQREGPLDMRMEGAGTSAAEVVNRIGEEPLADIIFRFGEERWARRIARAIVEARRTQPIDTTTRLAEIIRAAYPRAARAQSSRIDPATRTFQAIRIHVNDEIGELERGLAAAERLLGPGGRLAVVTFHSLEDRAVKSFLHERSGRVAQASRHQPQAASAPRPTFAAPRSLRPTPSEIAANPRARSARLRIAERRDPSALQSVGESAS